MSSIIKVNNIQDGGGNSIVSSNGSGTFTPGSALATGVLANTPAFRAYVGSNQTVSDATDTINQALEDSKFKEKTDLGQTHLIKSFIDLTKWKSERLAPKSYLKKDTLQLLGSDSSPLVVKWDK